MFHLHILSSISNLDQSQIDLSSLLRKYSYSFRLISVPTSLWESVHTHLDWSQSQLRFEIVFSVPNFALRKCSHSFRLISVPTSLWESVHTHLDWSQFPTSLWESIHTHLDWSQTDLSSHSRVHIHHIALDLDLSQTNLSPHGLKSISEIDLTHSLYWCKWPLILFQVVGSS